MGCAGPTRCGPRPADLHVVHQVDERVLRHRHGDRAPLSRMGLKKPPNRAATHER